MDTIKIQKKASKMIAHRGVSGLECENTCSAFVAAGNRSYFGIETDTHVTADGKFVIIHDENTERVSGVSANVEELSLDALSHIRLYDKTPGVSRSDLSIPTLEEYIRICHRYDKIAVLELKNTMAFESCTEIVRIITALDHIDQTIFISFSKQNCLHIRALLPKVSVQFLTSEWDPALLDWLVEYNLDLDIRYKSVTKELVDLIHEKGLEINVWTVDSQAAGEEMANLGVDYITTNILE